MIAFLQRFSIRLRLFLAIVLLLGPLGYGLWINLGRAQESVRFTQRELDGLAHFQKLMPVLRLMQEARGLSTGYLSGNLNMRGPLDAKLKELDTALAAVASDRPMAERFKVADAEAVVLQHWSEHKQKLFQKDPRTAFKDNTAILASILEIIDQTADESSLILDPEVESYFYMYASVILLPKISEGLGQLRAVGTGIASRKQISERERLDLAVRYGLALKEVQEIRRMLDKVGHVSDQATRDQVADFEAKMDNLLPLINQHLIEPAAPTIDPDTFFASATQTIRSGFEVGDRGTSLLQNSLSKRRTKERIAMLRDAGITGLLLVGTVLIQWIIVRSIVRPLRQIVSRVQNLAEAGADLSVRLEIHTNDELHDIAEGINQFIGHLRQIIIKIAESAKLASTSAVSLEGTALRFSDSVKNQAASSEESSASTEQVVASVTGIVENIAQQTGRIQDIDAKMSGFSAALAELAGSMKEFYTVSEATAEKAQLGDAAARQASEAMGKISDISRRIEEIVGVIGEISDQTDLLSLNASIEAARAGDAGRGFAVVSSEITKLSERTANNAQDIRKLIGEAGTAVNNGAGQVGQLTEYLAEMIKSVQTTTQTLSAMNAIVSEQSGTAKTIASTTGQIRALAQDVELSAGEQKRAIQEIGQAIELMSKETQNIVQSSEALTRSSREVLDVARSLEELVGHFKL
ncbi:MAG: methyl-accepting chemotaxis protein [Spirochaetia bacterium]|nr:methyl-accepting chemotaxis protein [Spirochaetia bacterium]